MRINLKKINKYSVFHVAKGKLIMGMSAGQARLLSITKRISNNEFRSQMITNSKLRLAEQSAEASEEYMNALNSKQLMFGTYDDNGIKSYSALTPNLLTTYSDLKNQYAMVTPSNKILVSGTDLKNYEASNGDLNVFLEKSGVARIEPDVELPSDNILSNSKNLLSSQFPCWNDTGINGILNDGDRFNAYYACHCEHVLAYILWDKNWNYKNDGEQKMTIDLGTKEINITNTGSENHFLTVAHTPDGQRTNGNASERDPLAQYFASDMDKFYEYYTPVMTTDGTTQATTTINLGGTELTVYAWTADWALPEGRTIQRTYYTTYDVLSLVPEQTTSPTSYTIPTSDGTMYYPGVYENGRIAVYDLNQEQSCFGLIPGTSKIKDDDLKIQDVLKQNPQLKQELQVAYYKTLCFIADSEGSGGTNPVNSGGAYGSGTPPYGGITGGSISDTNMYSNLSDEDVIDAFIDAMNKLTVEVVYNLYMNDQDKLNELLNKKNEDGTVDSSNYNAVMDIMKDYIAQKNEYIPDTTDAKYQWYVNLWYRMGGGDESQKNYKEIDPNLFNSAEWLEFALEHGMITLEQAQFNADGSVKYPEMGTYDWNSIIYTSASDIVSQDDEIAIARAEVRYKNKLTEIDNKDKKYEQDLKKLDTEHTALQTEYDSIKDVISKNVERSFKAFS